MKEFFKKSQNNMLHSTHPSSLDTWIDGIRSKDLGCPSSRKVAIRTLQDRRGAGGRGGSVGRTTAENTFDVAPIDRRNAFIPATADKPASREECAWKVGSSFQVPVHRKSAACL